MTTLPTPSEQQERHSPRLDRAAVAGAWILWLLGQTGLALITMGMTWAVGWLLTSEPAIHYAPNPHSPSANVTVQCDSLVTQALYPYYVAPAPDATGVQVACAQQLAGRAALVGVLAPLALLCWVGISSSRRRTFQARASAMRDRLVQHVEPGGGR